MMNGINKLNVVHFLLIIQQLVRSQEVSKRQLHVCNDATAEIILNCTSSHMILVESAVIGTSVVWSGGTTDCPRNNETCVKQITQPQTECNNKSSCSLRMDIIGSDVGNSCQPSNYINITYVCIPVTNSGNIIRICGSSPLRQISSLYVESYNFPEVMSAAHSCHCEINSTQQNNLTIKAAYFKIGPISPNCGKENNSQCEEQLLLRKNGETKYDSNNRSSNTFMEMRNQELLIATEFQQGVVLISFIKSSAEQYRSRFLLYVKSNKSVNIQCYNSSLRTISYPPTSTAETTTSGSGKTPPSITSTDTLDPVTGKSTINSSRFSQEFYTPTTDGSSDFDSDQQKSRTTCSVGCIAGITSSLVVAVTVVVLVVVLRKRRNKKKSDEKPCDIVSPNDSEIVKNKNNSGIDDNFSSMDPAISSPGSALSSPGSALSSQESVIFSNPEYRDSNIAGE